MALFQSKKAENIQQAPSSGAVPHHVAIIMDGNGRWAKARGLPRIAGHKKGSDALREILKGCKGLGVDYLTIYAFSSENWRRPEEEVKELMGLLRLYLNSEIKTLHENKINLKIIGDLSRLSDDIRTDIENAELLTANNTEFYLQVALSYGSRQELLTAMKRVAEDVSSGTSQRGQLSWS